jgi:hypothetical protein
MRIQRFQTFIVVIALVCGGIVAPLRARAGQETINQSNDGLMNLPSTPLKLSRSAGSILVVKNVSPSQVISFRIGCVLGEGEKIRILSKREESAVKLDPPNDKGMSRYIFGAFHSPAEYCEPSEAKLAVVEVSFADGAKWMVQQH